MSNYYFTVCVSLFHVTFITIDDTKHEGND